MWRNEFVSHFSLGAKELLVLPPPPPQERKSQSNRVWTFIFSFLWCESPFFCISIFSIPYELWWLDKDTLRNLVHTRLIITRRHLPAGQSMINSLLWFSIEKYVTTHFVKNNLNFLKFLFLFVQMIRTIAVSAPASPTLWKTSAKAIRNLSKRAARPRSKWRWRPTSAHIRRPCLMAIRCRLTRCGTRGASTVEWVWDN